MRIYFKYTPSLMFSRRAFTLVELIVVMAIATVIMTVIAIQQNSWNDRLSVSTQAYDLALTIRQAQIYGLGVREDTSGSGGDKFNVGYGVYFDNNNTRYIYFVDRNENQRYDSGELLETKIFTRGVIIKDVCGSSRCIYTGGGSLRKASILFFRPEPKANINLLTNGGNWADNPPITIKLQSIGGKIFSVKVEANGQVSITQ